LQAKSDGKFDKRVNLAKTPKAKYPTADKNSTQAQKNTIAKVVSPKFSPFCF